MDSCIAGDGKKAVFCPVRFHRGSTMYSQQDQTGFLHYQGILTVVTEMMFFVLLFSAPSETFSVQ